jgi:hypothetical protein
VYIDIATLYYYPNICFCGPEDDETFLAHLQGSETGEGMGGRGRTSKKEKGF